MYNNHYFAWGERAEAHVFSLTDEEALALSNNLVTMRRASLAYACAFGCGYEYAIPVTEATLEFLIEGYDGAQATKLKYLAACIVTGRPFNDDGGGQKIPADGGPAPKSPSPVMGGVLMRSAL
jgi:hypothetical protein